MGFIAYRCRCQCLLRRIKLMPRFDLLPGFSTLLSRVVLMLTPVKAATLLLQASLLCMAMPGVPSAGPSAAAPSPKTAQWVVAQQSFK